MLAFVAVVVVATTVFVAGCSKHDTRKAPDVAGKTLEEALDYLDGNLFAISLVPEIDGTCDGVRLSERNTLRKPLPADLDTSACRVVRQLPAPGAIMSIGDTVRVTVR